MRSLILLINVAMAAMALASEPSKASGDQGSLTTAPQQHKVEYPHIEGIGSAVTKKEDLSMGYVFDLSKKSTRGYDENGRQEVVNVGPGMTSTIEGQIKSSAGRRGRQRGAILPNKYIVRLKSGADFSSVNLRSKIAERNRSIKVQPNEHEAKQQDSQQHENQDMIPNQVDHEYDFGSWKGYAGQFSLDLLKELESHNDVEYIEEDTMVWAWGMESESVEQGQEQGGSQSSKGKNETDSVLLDESRVELSIGHENEANFKATAPPRLKYLSAKAPSWGLTRISQRILDLKKDYSYASTAGAGVDVYVIDSGVYKDHSDFESRATSLANFVAGEEETDTCGHGTHVAGIIAGRQFGVAKAANIYAIKVLNSSGQGSTSQVLAGINHMVRHASKDPSRKKVVNMSLGGTYSKTLNEAVSAAVLEHNLPFFVAAGNTGDDACRYSPAAAPEAFPVGGSDNTDQIGWYSCVGPCVKIFAPGSGIVSDWNRPGSAKIMDGTSMAAPHVAGVAALFLSSGNKYTKAKDLYADILRYATPKIIRGPFGADDRTTQSLLYNKMEDVVKGARKGARKGRKNKH